MAVSDDTQLEGYAKNLDLTTRGDMADNKYFKETPAIWTPPRLWTWPTRLYLEVLRDQFPAGTMAAMLQRAYYEDTDIDTVIADGKKAMRAISDE